MIELLKLYHNMSVLTPMGEGLVEGRTACAESPKIFVRIPVENLPPEMRTAMQARHLTCGLYEFDQDSLVPVVEGKKITRVTKGTKIG